MNHCTITILDEVNVKISGLELTERKKLMQMFEFHVPGAKYSPAVRLGRWNGKTSYFSIGGATYVNLLDQIIPVIQSAGYDIEIDDRRNPSQQFEFDIVDSETFKHKMWPEGHPLAGQPVELRDYQIDLINNFLQNLQSMQEASTGSGKTICTAALSYSVEKYGRSLVIVPSKSLVVQTEADYINLGLNVGVYFGDRKELNRTHTICTWQSLNGLLKATSDGTADFTIHEFLDGVICVMIDECHSAKANALKTLLTSTMSHIPIRWGLTGTIPKEKSDAYALLVSLGAVVGKVTAKELQDKGVLAQCNVNVIQLNDEMNFRDYQSELKFLTENTARLAYIAEVILKLSKTGNTLVLVDRLEAGTKLLEMVGDANAVFISGSTSLKNRKKEFDAVTSSDDKIVIATFGVAAVGINIVKLHNVILLEPGKSFVRVIQSIGRGLRKGHDKDRVEIYDITSSCKFSKRHLATRKQFYDDAQYPYNVQRVDYL